MKSTLMVACDFLTRLRKISISILKPHQFGQISKSRFLVDGFSKKFCAFFRMKYDLVRNLHSVPTKILVCQRVPKQSAVLACLTMAKLKMNQRGSNKNADLLKKSSIMGTESLHFTF